MSVWVTPHPPNVKDMPMTLEEYCAWHFNADALYKGFEVREEEVLPPLSTVISYETEVEGNQAPELYALSLDMWKDDALLKCVAKELAIDLSFPNYTQHIKTICRWIISQENLIARNLSERELKARFNVMYNGGYETLDSPFRLFGSFLYDTDYKNIPGMPKACEEIFSIIHDNWNESYTIMGWIQDEARVVVLAKELYTSLGGKGTCPPAVQPQIADLSTIPNFPEHLYKENFWTKIKKIFFSGLSY